jgi:5-methylcytosine-specific restriction endonuclease McrA
MTTIACATCSEQFTAKSSRAKYCSRRCKDKGKPSASGLSCYICGKTMVKGPTSKPQSEAAHNQCRTEANTIYTHGTTGYGRGCRCDTCKAEQVAYFAQYVEAFKAEHGLHPNTLRRKKFKEEHGYWPQAGSTSWIEPSLRHQLYERDNWTCQICNKPIDREANRNTNYAPSLDHIVPQSHMLLPDHSPSNLRTVHRLCNSKRGDRVDDDSKAQQFNTGQAPSTHS